MIRLNWERESLGYTSKEKTVIKDFVFLFVMVISFKDFCDRF